MLPNSNHDSAKLTSMEVDDQKSSATHEVHQDTLDASGFHQTSPAITLKGRSKAWQPRQHASHIFKGANGTWYMRLAATEYPPTAKSGPYAMERHRSRDTSFALYRVPIVHAKTITDVLVPQAIALVADLKAREAAYRVLGLPV